MELAAVTRPKKIVFVSHAHQDVTIADEIAGLLRTVGLEGFIAHRDIDPTLAWSGEIKRALKECVALVAVVTPNFLKSNWVDQEVGWVMGRERPVVPLNAGAAPAAFLGEIQMAPWSRDANSDRQRDRRATLAKGLLLQKVFDADDLIAGLRRCTEFFHTDAVLPLVPRLAPLAAAQAVALAESVAATGSVYNAYGASDIVRPLIEPYAESIPQVVRIPLAKKKFLPTKWTLPTEGVSDTERLMAELDEISGNILTRGR